MINYSNINSSFTGLILPGKKLNLFISPQFVLFSEMDSTEIKKEYKSDDSWKNIPEDKKMKDIYNLFEEFKNYNENWDSYDAPQISTIAISQAKSYLRKIFDLLQIIPDFVAPTRSSGIVVEYKFDNITVTYKFFEDGSISYQIIKDRLEILIKEFIQPNRVITPNKILEYLNV